VSSADVPRLRIEQGTAPELGSFIPGAAWEAHRDRSGRICAYTFGHEGESWLYVPGLAYYRLWPGNGYVDALVEPEAVPSTVADAFYRIALPMALQAAGHEVLHASAVADAQRVHVFCGASRSGKSTVAHALTSRGLSPWADDAVAFTAHEGRPTAIPLPFALRLRDDVADFYGVPRPGDRAERKAEVLRGRAGRPLEIASISLLERGNDPGVVRLPGHEALPGVLYHSFYVSLDDQAVRGRMSRQFLDLVATVPVYRVSVPSALGAVDGLLDELERAVLRSTEEP
jgi:hypothetical protein